MIFLGPLYHLLAYLLADRVNHFPLIRLLVFSLDKTILYVLIFIAISVLIAYLKKRRQPQWQVDWSKYGHVLTFFIYLVLLLHLTVLRYDWQWWRLSLVPGVSLKDFHWLPLVDTIKLAYGDSSFSYWYNFFGNVLWFIPFGWLLAYFFRGQRSFFRVLLMGMGFSFMIECGQLFLGTGLGHIDDVIFNSMGVVIGHFAYDFKHFFLMKHESR
ncbi:VanZ family protein [Aerococcus urinae]|uniref:VanZ family protein n=1 Tax=Aerococcus mictus TaxID=2976810 RepID=A0A1E9PPA9_9LACT|nr:MULTISPECIES: VanZ family protein [Aerococcus]KAA9293130.1 VanZ family protein [Aerococcus mictus]MBU5609728.1 VanZ family protein [Aerococcus urinae]MCY3034620.1 VanZ family protein [Aerococcus mictus]MCY3063574.1 VanZ family protein [Aerococcus mictus]MCY3065960.1 VanZ family protein [Aerococcus mictus]